MKTSKNPSQGRGKAQQSDGIAVISEERSGQALHNVASRDDSAGRETTQEVLRASEIRYRRLFEFALDGVLILDAKTGQIDDANPFLSALMGYSHEELLGKKIWEIGPLRNVAASRSAFVRLRKSGYIRYDDLPLETRSGQQIQIEVVSNVYEADHKLVIQCNIRDITERMQTQDELLASEIRYRRLFESAKDGILILNAETGQIDDVNPFLLKLLGYSYEELLGKKVWEIGPFKNIAASRAAFIKLRKTGYIRYDDLPLETHTGEHVQVEFVSNVYEADHSQVIQCNIRDITERDRAQRAEREQQTFAEAMRDTAVTLTGTLNPDEVLDRIVENVGLVVPFEAASIILLSADNIWVARCRGFGGAEGDQNMLALHLPLAEIPHLQLMATTSRAAVMAHKPNDSARLALPETAWVRSSVGAPIRLGEKVIGFIVLDSNLPDLFTDIHARHLQAFANQAAIAIKNARLYYEIQGYTQALEHTVLERTKALLSSKAHIEAILNSVGDALMVMASDGLIRQVNPEFELQTGFLSDEAIFHYYSDLLLANGPSHYAVDQAAVAMQAGNGWRGQMVLSRRDGTTYDADMTIAPLRDPTGEATAFVGTMRDISELKDIERMKDAFVANVSHELRTPITSLKLYYTLLGLRPEKTEVYKGHMQRELRRLERIVEDLLDLSRLDQQKDELKLKPIDINELIAQVVSDRELVAESAHVSLALKQTAGVPPAYIEEGKIGQVLSILLTNAFAYTPPGGNVLVTTMSRKKEDQTWVGFSVADNGPGILQSERNRIFSRFFRGVAGRRSSTPGTGLGLAIAGEIVRQHRGEIDMQSEGLPGKGTSFTVWLPSGQPG